VHQARILGLAQDAKGFLLADRARDVTPIKCTLDRRKHKAIACGPVAPFAYQLLLETADAFAYGPGLGTLEEFCRSLVRKDLDAGGHSLFHRDHAVDRWRDACETAPGLLDVLFKEHRQFPIQPGQLLLVDANHEWHEPKDKLSILPAQ
jgi:hypothetical protein